METITRAIELRTVSCPSCGIIFAIPAAFMAKLRQYHTSFYCPSGHSMSYNEDLLLAARRQLEEKNAELDRARATAQRLRDEAATAERSARAARGHVTRIKKRLSHGVCPCCTRTFSNLAQHMHQVHPGFSEEQKP